MFQISELAIDEYEKRIPEDGYFSGMSEKEIADYKEAEKHIEAERTEQYHKDVQLIRDLKKKLPKKLFNFIAVALHESENWDKLEIVDNPTGKYQQETKHSGMWVDQYVGYCGDDYSGYCYVKLPDEKYLKWEYWC